MIRPVMNEELSKRFQFLIDLIPEGKQDAISMKALSKLVELPSSDVRQMILNARKVGILICSGDEGYYFPADDNELKEYRNRRRKYIKTATIALQPFENKLKEREGSDQG